MFRHIKIIFLKEFKEVIRDKRSWVTALMVSIFMPASMLAGLTIASYKAQIVKTSEYQITGAEYAPALVVFLNNKGLITKTDLDDKHVQLNIPADFREKISKGYIPKLTIQADYFKQLKIVSKLEEALGEYEQEIAISRLVARGIAPIALKPFDVDIQDTGGASIFAKTLVPMLVFIFILVPITALMPAVIDSTAGERERHGIFPVLLQPVSPISIILGKYLMFIFIGTLALSIATTICFVGFNYIKVDGFNAGLNMTPLSSLFFIAIMIPTVSWVCAIIMGLTVFAKTFKEGQTYAGLSIFIPMLFMGSGFLIDEKWRAHWPIWSEITAAGSLLTNNDVSIVAWLGTVFIYVVIILVSILWMTQKIRRQAIESQG